MGQPEMRRTGSRPGRGGMGEFCDQQNPSAGQFSFYLFNIVIFTIKRDSVHWIMLKHCSCENMYRPHEVEQKMLFVLPWSAFRTAASFILFLERGAANNPRQASLHCFTLKTIIVEIYLIIVWLSEFGQTVSKSRNLPQVEYQKEVTPYFWRYV